MDFQSISLHYSDPLWIAIAFLCGLSFRAIGLPPMVGFLVAGFVLNVLGASGGELLSALADLGITLLLFTIGLKLRLASLARPEVWGTASIHLVLFSLVITGFLLALSFSGLPLVSVLDLPTALLVGFAMSFSSTVFAVKALEELGATNSRHGNTAIGVLVVQDIAAVFFVAASLAKLPSPWALVLLALLPLRWVLFKILDRVGHGELLVLFGIVWALTGAHVFELVSIKADVGALIFGMLLASHPKAKELAASLLSFKELFLVGFFLSVGMTALPGWVELLIAVLFVLILPIKTAMYLGLFNLFRLRSSTAWRASLNLSNYSEFGLIVGAIAATAGWLPKEWLTVFAVVILISFILSAQLMNVRDTLYIALRPKLERLERAQRLAGEEDLELDHIKVVVFGMGRMGRAAYAAMEEDYVDHLVGVEIDQSKADAHCAEGRNVVCGDATNPDFWTRAPSLIDGLEWVLLTMPVHRANMLAAEILREKGYKGKIAATSKFPDEEEALRELGVAYTFNIYTEAGFGFANELKNHLSNGATNSVLTDDSRA